MHMTHFAKLKIETKNLDFARYGPFRIFVTSTFFVIWGARLILGLQKVEKRNTILGAELHPIAMATGIQKSETR